MKHESIQYFKNETPLSVELEIKVNTYDIDVANHVNNIVYLRWLEDLRNSLFSQVCPLEEILKLNYYPVVVYTEMKYKKQIVLFDKPVGKVWIDKNPHGIIVLKAEIRTNNKIAFTATQKCVLLNLTTNIIYKGEIVEIASKLAQNF